MRCLADTYKKATAWQKFQLLYILFELLNSCVYYQFKIIQNYYIVIIFAIITLFLCIQYYYKNISKLIKTKPLLVIILIFTMVASTLYRSSYYDGFKSMKAVKTILVQYIWLSLLFHDHEIQTEKEHAEFVKFKNTLFQIVIIFTLLVSLVSLSLWVVVVIFHLNTYAYTSLDILQNGRLSALYFNSDLAGITPLISMLLSMNVLSENHSWFPVTNKINIIIQTIVLVLSGCRSAILPFSIILVLYVLSKVHISKISERRIFLALIISVLLLQFILTLGRIPYYQSTEKTFVTIADNLTSYRYSLWKEIFILFMLSPIWGNGLYSIVSLAKVYLPANSVIISGNYDLCHNLYISSLYNTGIIGFLCIIVLTIIVVKELKLNRKYVDIHIFNSEVSIIFSLFIYSLFNPGVLFVTDFPSPIFWLLMGYIITINSYYKKCQVEISAKKE